MTKRLLLTSPQGFCAGVQRAILVLEKALEKFGAPIYVNHEIVHNRYLVSRFESLGVIFEPDIKSIPENSVLVFSAHGVSPLFREECQKKNLNIIDATCPLVNKVHEEAKRYKKLGYEIILIGHKNHQEVIGTTGVVKMEVIENMDDIKNLSTEVYKNNKVVCLTQTTLSVDETSGLIEKLKLKIPHLELQTDICYATKNRQNAVKAIAKECDFFIVIGSEASSNSNRLVDTARGQGCEAKLFENVESIPDSVLMRETIGITSGASVPSILVEQVIQYFKMRNPSLKIEQKRLAEERLSFPLPKKLI